MARKTQTQQQRKLTAKPDIDSTMPIEAQIKALDKLIADQPATSRIIEFGPELAEHVLDSMNVGNRPMKSGKIKEYAKSLAAGLWGVTGDTIKFGSDGNLKDGQNRLRAVQRARRPMTTHVVFGINPELFARMDIGKNRTPADIFALKGVPYSNHTAATCRWLMILTSSNPANRGVHYTNDELWEFYQTKVDPTKVFESVQCGMAIKKNTGSPVASVAALHYLFALDDLEKANAFMADWANGRGSERAPQTILQRRLAEMMAHSRGRIHESVRNAMIIRSWHAYRQSKPIGRGALAFDITADRFPAVRVADYEAETKKLERAPEPVE